MPKMQEDGLEIRKKWGVGQLEFSVTAIPVSGRSLYTKLLIRTEKSSIECTMNDYNVQTPRKDPSTSTNITFPISG